MNEISTDPLREALQVLICSNLPVDAKRLLIDVVLEALAQREALVVQATTRQNQTVWTSAEIEMVTARLQGQVARSWQSADQVLTQLARELQRDARQIRAKAIELDLGVAVDYHMAKLSGGKAEVM